MSEQQGIVARVLAGDVRSAARLMRHVDDDHPQARRALDALFPHTGRAMIVGMTGNPGSGKSTLVDRLIHGLRARGKTVGCVAVDPTSPFSGGAILGDRVRMQEHALDEGVFIRSVATRGTLGGVSRSTPAMIQILDAMGFDVILVETVGVGQAEVDIVKMADTSVVVTVPGLGDDVQANKAGLMEIADVFVINKADRDGHQRLQRELRTMLNLAPHPDEDDDEPRWRPPILKTVATTGEGVEALLDTLDEHRAFLEEQGMLRQRDARRAEHFVRLSAESHLHKLLDQAMATDRWADHRDRLAGREEGAEEARRALLEMLREGL